MATIADLNIRLGLLSKQFERDLRGMERRLQRSADKLSRIGSDLSTAISLPLAGIGFAAIKSAGDIEALRLALNSTMEDAGRSTEEATAELEALRKAALAPGLDFEQAVKGSIRLQNVGFAAEDARGILEQLANAVALTGGSAQELDSVTRQFAQMISKGRILQEDLSIIQENMPAISKAMEQAFGTRSADQLRELGITAEDFIKGITQQFGELPRVSGGIKNSLVNLFVGLKLEAARLGEEINKAFNVGDAADGILKAVRSVVDAFAGLSDGAKKTIVQIGLFVVALGPAIRAIGAFKGLLALTTGSFNSVVRTISGASGFFAQFAVAGSDTARAISEIGKATRAAALGKTFLNVSTSAEYAASAVSGFKNSVASMASVASASQTTSIAKKVFVPLGKAADGAALAAARMRVAFIAATAGLAVVLAGVAAAVALMADRFDAASYVQEKFNEAKAETVKVTAQEVAALNRNFDVLKNVNASTDERKQAIDDLLRTYPQYLEGIDLEKKSIGELTTLQDKLNKEILQGIADRQKTAAVTALYEKQAAILLRIQEIQRTNNVTAGEATLISTGDAVRAGGRAAAVVIKLREQVAELGQQATVTAKDFDKAFGLQERAVNLQLQREYDLRDAYYASREALEDGTLAVNNDTESTVKNTGAKSAATRQAELYRKALASIQAVADKGDVLGADVISEQAREIENQIERLLENGFKPYSEEILHLRDMLKGLFDDIRVPQLEVGVSALPTIALPDQVARIDVQVAGAAEIDALTAAANRGIEAAEVFGTYWANVSEIMIGLQERTISVSEAVNQSVELLRANGQNLEATFVEMANAMGNAFAEAKGGFGEMALAAVAAGAKIIKVTIQEGVARAVASAVESAPFPLNLILGPIAGGIAAGIFSKAISSIGVPALAEGGVVNKPTLALIGEYPGAATDPEIVAPESKLRKIFESGDGATGKLIATVKGDDLQFVLDRAGTRRGRTR